jgi:hypothetical protein
MYSDRRMIIPSSRQVDDPGLKQNVLKEEERETEKKIGKSLVLYSAFSTGL